MATLTDAQCETLIAERIEWIRYTTPPDLSVVLPISGGSDSAFCLWLYARAVPGRVTGIYQGDALRCADWFTAQSPIVYVTESAPLLYDMEIFRWAYFLQYSLAHHAVLVGSRTRTEHELGTFSLASRVASTLPLVDLWKSDIMELCAHIQLPQEIISSSQEADPPCGRPAELAIIPFEEVDTFLKNKIAENEPPQNLRLSEAQTKYLNGLYDKNLFKKHLPAQPITPA